MLYASVSARSQQALCACNPSWALHALERNLARGCGRPVKCLKAQQGSPTCCNLQLAHKGLPVNWCLPWCASSRALLTGCVARRGCLEAPATS